MWKIEIMVEFVLILLAMGIAATLIYYFKNDVKNFFTSVKRWFNRHRASIASVSTVGVLLGAGGGSIVLDNMPTGYIPSEGIEDLVGAMTDGGTETHIAVTYQDGTSDIDFVVSDDWWDAVGDITDDTLTENKLVIDNAPVDEYSLTWEAGTGEMHWQDVSGGGSADGYFLNGTVQNTEGNTFAATTAGLQAAIDECEAAGGGTVYIPADTTITITSVITITEDGVNLVGCGNSSVLKLGNGENSDILRIGTYESTGASNLTISDIRFDMNMDNNAGTSDNNMNTIDIRGYSRDVTIKDCYFQDGIGAFIVCHLYTSWITVDNCHFDTIEERSDYYPEAIWFEGDYCIASNNMIRDTFAAGIIFESGTAGHSSSYCIADSNIITGNIGVGIYMEGNDRADNGTIVNNHIFDINSSAYDNVGSDYQAGILAMNNSIISNNRIENVWQYGIRTRDDVTISNNVILNVGGSGTLGNEGAGDGIYADYGSASIISGNRIENIRANGIYAANGIQTACDNIIRNCGSISIYKIDFVRDNYIYDSGDTGVHTAEMVSGNYIETSANYAIKANDYMNICSNILVNTGEAGTGIEIAAGRDDVVVSGNTISGFVRGASIYDAFNTTLNGNRLYGNTNGIDERGSSDWTLCVGNNGRGCTDGIDVDAANSINQHNLE